MLNTNFSLLYYWNPALVSENLCPTWNCVVIFLLKMDSAPLEEPGVVEKKKITKLCRTESLTDPRRETHLPHGWVQYNAFGVVKLQVQQDDASGAVFGAHEDALVYIIYEVEVSSQPVDGHLLHI